jgi:hypothetical protein
MIYFNHTLAEFLKECSVLANCQVSLGEFKEVQTTATIYITPCKAQKLSFVNDST